MGYSEAEKIVMPLALLTLIILSLFFTLLLYRKPTKMRSIPTVIIAVLLIAIELVKQIRNLCGDFNSFQLPFHYCSLFVPIFALAELLGKRLSRIFRPIAVSMSFVVSAGLYIYPTGIIGSACENFGKVFTATHSFIFHHLIVWYLILTILLRLAILTYKDALNVGILGAVYMAAAIPLSYALNTNYNNILESVIPLLEDFRLNFGQAPYIFLLFLAMTLGMSLATLLYIGIQNAFFRLFKK